MNKLLVIVLLAMLGCTNVDNNADGYVNPEACGQRWLCPGEPLCDTYEFKFMCEEFKVTDTNNIYKEHGYNSRKEYLNSLADEHGVDAQTVYDIADLLGDVEDFDGLVSALGSI